MKNVLNCCAGISKRSATSLFFLGILLIIGILLAGSSDFTSLSVLDFEPGCFQFLTAITLLVIFMGISSELVKRHEWGTFLVASGPTGMPYYEAICDYEPETGRGHHVKSASAIKTSDNKVIALNFNSTLNEKSAAFAKTVHDKASDFDNEASDDGNASEKTAVRLIPLAGEDGHTSEQIQFGGRPRTPKDLAENQSSDPERLKYLLRSSPAVIYTCDAYGDYPVTFMSENVRFTLGYDPEEFLWAPKFRMDRIHQEDAPRVLAGISLLSEAGYYTYEYRFLHKNGTYRWMRDELRLMLDASGQPKEILGSWFDISEQKRAEDELRLALKRLREMESIINRSPAIVFLWRNTEGLPVEFVSDNIRQFGYTPGEFLNEQVSFAEMIHPEDLNRVLSEVANCAPDTQTECHQQYRMLTKTGDARWVTGSHTIRCDADGRITHYEGIILDDTEKRLAEKQLRKAESRFRTLIEQVPAITYVMARETLSAVYVSPQVENVLGFTQSECQSDPKILIKRLHPEDRQRVINGLKRAFSAGVTSVSEYRMLTKSNKTVWFRDASRPISNERGHPDFLQGVMLDVSDRKRAEEEIRDLNKNLEDRVRERTTELEAANRSLQMEIAVRKLAEMQVRKLNQELTLRARELGEVNKELKAFSYSVSHDLRSPARMICGFSQALLEDYADKLEGEGQKYLQSLISASLRMEQLIDDMLKLSQVTRAELRVVDVDLSELALTIVSEYRKVEPHRNVEFILESGLIVKADFNLIRIAMENLLQNAWKFTGRAQQARIELGCTQHCGETVYFLRDNGAGFDMEFSSRLFGVFQRLHNSDEFEGTGIGLATVRRIINRHGGRIWAEASVDNGATFYFTLPGQDLTIESNDQKDDSSEED